MIPDWETDHLFLSDLLETEQPELFRQRVRVLRKVKIDFVSETRDIWCRDYMPVQLDEDSFRQFVYNPDYLQGVVRN